MRASTISLALLLALVLCSCQPSLLPFYTTFDEIEIPTIVGEWYEASEDDSSIYYTITGDSNGYQVVYHQGDTIKEYEVHAFVIDKLTFLDVVQVPTYSEDALNNDLFLQEHLVARIIMYPDSMQLGFLNSEWYAEMIDEEEITAPFLVMESGYLITATAEQMRPVLKKYGDDIDAFPPTTLYRLANN